jgi:peptidoglycan/LPS O-acetylase OafA/YrhL
LAALCVLFFHLRTPQGQELHFAIADPFSKYGYLGVDLFFVLSGFLLSHGYGVTFTTGLRASDIRRYAVARFARIYPLHLLAMILMLGAYWAAAMAHVPPTETEGYSAKGFLVGLTLTHEWFGIIATNPSSWSISVELASYILFPFAVGYIFRLRGYVPLLLAACCAIIIGQFASERMLRSVAEFATGCLTYTAGSRFDIGRFRYFAAPAFVTPFVAAYVAGGELPAASAGCFAFCILCLAVKSDEPFHRFCSSPPALLLGEMSYSIYLLQWFIWIGWKHAIARVSPFVGHPYLLIAGAAASIITCAFFSYRYFEVPARTALRRLHAGTVTM